MQLARPHFFDSLLFSLFSGKTGEATPAVGGGILMNDKPLAAGKPDPAAEYVRALAKARGLDRAYALFPDIVAAAVARAAMALSPLPADFPATTEPAIVFDPSKFVEAK